MLRGDDCERSYSVTAVLQISRSGHLRSRQSHPAPFQDPHWPKGRSQLCVTRVNPQDGRILFGIIDVVSFLEFMPASWGRDMCLDRTAQPVTAKSRKPTPYEPRRNRVPVPTPPAHASHRQRATCARCAERCGPRTRRSSPLQDASSPVRPIHTLSPMRKPAWLGGSDMSRRPPRNEWSCPRSCPRRPRPLRRAACETVRWFRQHREESMLGVSRARQHDARAHRVRARSARRGISKRRDLDHRLAARHPQRIRPIPGSSPARWSLTLWFRWLPSC
jgi:hypothetical protein